MKLFLTGRPGIGKTTIIKKFVERHRDKVVGFWTEEMRDSRNGERIGFMIFTTQGNSAVLARKGLHSPFRVGKYGVDLGLFESLVLGFLDKAIENEEKIVVIDEVGKMELFSPKFQRLVEEIVFLRENPVLGTIPESNFHPLLKRIKSSDRVKVILITEKNRNSVFSILDDFFNVGPHLS